jgi:uncharacterized protein YciW
VNIFKKKKKKKGKEKEKEKDVANPRNTYKAKNRLGIVFDFSRLLLFRILP